MQIPLHAGMAVSRKLELRPRDPRAQPAEGRNGDGNGGCLHPVLSDAPVPLQPACSNKVRVHGMHK